MSVPSFVKSRSATGAAVPGTTFTVTETAIGVPTMALTTESSGASASPTYRTSAIHCSPCPRGGQGFKGNRYNNPARSAALSCTRILSPAMVNVGEQFAPDVGFQGPWNWRNNRGTTGLNIRHKFVASYTYELPFGKGRRWMERIMRRCLLLALGLASWLTWAQQARFDSHHSSTVMVAMRDGVRLATDVYRPARAGRPVEGRFPVIIYRTPYNKNGLAKDAAFLARQGYVVLAQDCRGRFASEGRFYAFVNEGRDGYDTIEWAAAQPWSDGRVGTAGASYLAWDQYHAAMYRPPHLAAMFALVGGADFYQEYAYPGGAPNLGWPAWLLRSAATSREAAQAPESAARLQSILKDPWQWLALHPRQRLETFRNFPDHFRMYRDLLEHPEFDQAWRQRGFYVKGYYRDIKDVPTLLLSGWYDYFAEGVLENFQAFARLHKSPTYLIMGPWPHGTGAAQCGDADFGAQAALDQTRLMLEFFDHFLKGQPSNSLGREPVRYFLMGGGDGARGAGGRLRHGGQWRTASSWPPASVHTSRYYLAAGARLITQAPSEQGARSFVFDPDNPVPTIGGRYGVPGTPPCAQNQLCSPKIPGCKDARPLAEREDVLSYSTPPLETPIAIAGQIRVTLWVASDAPDTDFTAKLVDVYPDGYALILADGQIRMRYRESFSRPTPMKPGQPYCVQIPLGSTANLFARGHRIRLEVSSSNYPKFEPNPNTGEPVTAWTRRAKARNSVYHGGRRASFLELPVLTQAQ